ncbi:MAG TPA: ROK family protein [Candidatus Binatia bacterium]|nr:ROK family protein [Candidatus Binatia bacterium]
MTVAIGVDIGGTAIKIGAVDDQGKLLESERIEVYRDIPFADFLGLLNRATENLMERHRPVAIGIGVPGVPNPQTGMLTGRCPAIPSLMEGSLSEILGKRFGVPAQVRNDAVGATYGEMRHGAGRHYQRFALFTLGTGIGGAVVIDRKIIDGPNGLSPQFGCMSMDPARTDIARPVPGMLENLASASALVARCRELKPGVDTPDAKAVVERAKQGEPEALQAFDEMTRWLGQAVGIMSNMLNLEAVIFGGGVAHAGDFLTERVSKHSYDFVLLKPGRPPKILTAEHGNNAGIIGASVLAMDAYQDANGAAR